MVEYSKVTEDHDKETRRQKSFHRIGKFKIIDYGFYIDGNNELQPFFRY